MTNTVKHAKDVACETYGLTRADLEGPRRFEHFFEARMMAMAAIRERAGLSLPRIGELFGGRDHTTVMHALRHHERLVASDPQYHDAWLAFVAEVRARNDRTRRQMMGFFVARYTLPHKYQEAQAHAD